MFNCHMPVRAFAFGQERQVTEVGQVQWTQEPDNILLS